MSWDDFDGKKGGGRDFRPPDFKLPDFKLPKLNFPVYLLLIIPVLLYIITSGFYVVEQDEVGVVLRLGREHRVSEPGIHFKFPLPIEEVYTPKVTEVKREEIGFRIEFIGPPARYRDVPAESLMLTGDENIIDIDVVVQYKIWDAADYLFNVTNPTRTLHVAAEAAIREIIGSHGIDAALTEGKARIEVQIKDLLQEILDRYRAGIRVTAIKLQDVHPPHEVKASFKDVASAREDMNRLINEAQGYKNTIIPEARGAASKIVKTALGYKEEKINHSEGDAKRFLSVLQEYRKAKEVTRRRLYLEAMEEVLAKVTKYVISGDDGVMPLLHLGDTNIKNLKKKRKK